MLTTPRRPHLCFVVESGTDVRLVEGLAERFDLTILARRIEGGVEVSHPPATAVPVIVASPSRVSFGASVARYLMRRRGEIDFVLVQGYGLAALAANLAHRRTGVPTAMLVCSPVEAYYSCRRSNPEAGKPFREWELGAQKVLARLNAAAATRYLVLSEHLAEVVRGHGASSPIEVLPLYGVDTEVFRPAEEPKIAIRRRLGLPASGSIIFFSSRIAPEKDSETLLLAVRSLLRSGRDLWLLHRSGGFRAFLRDAERFGVADRVIASEAVHPHRGLPEQYQASDLCVQASRAEGLGFSPLEALACEVPVIATAVGGLRETIVDGATGWSYAVGDALGLARCIEVALDDPAESARRAAAGRTLVRSRFDRKIVFDALARLVRAEMRNPRPE